MRREVYLKRKKENSGEPQALGILRQQGGLAIIVEIRKGNCYELEKKNLMAARSYRKKRPGHYSPFYRKIVRCVRKGGVTFP